MRDRQTDRQTERKRKRKKERQREPLNIFFLFPLRQLKRAKTDGKKCHDKTMMRKSDKTRTNETRKWYKRP